MQAAGCGALVLSALDEVAWLTNLRGADVAFNPVFYSYAIVTGCDVSVYVDLDRVTPEARAQLQGVKLRPYSSAHEDITALAQGADQVGQCLKWNFSLGAENQQAQVSRYIQVLLETPLKRQ